MLPVIGAGFYALAHITTRTKCQDVPLAALSLSQNLIMALAGFVVSAALLIFPAGELAQSTPYIFANWSAITLSDALILVILAGFAIGLGILLAGAYKAAPPSTVATFEYSYLVFVAIWDVLFFAIFPSFTSLTGMGLIVLAGLLVLRR